MIYVCFLAFCALSSVRDVLSEVYFKQRELSSNPVYTVFVYSVVTQVVAVALMLAFPSRFDHKRLFLTAFRKENMVINICTLTAFFSYFAAIASPLGAALNAFVDYGIGPAATALVGVVMGRVRLTRLFLFSAGASLSGIAAFAAPRFEAENISIWWLFGVLFCCT